MFGFVSGLTRNSEMNTCKLVQLSYDHEVKLEKTLLYLHIIVCDTELIIVTVG